MDLGSKEFVIKPSCVRSPRYNFKKINVYETKIYRYKLVMATGLSRPGKSREGPGTGQDLETLKVPWSCGPGTKEVQKSRDFFLRSRDSRPLFLDRNFVNKVQN